MKIAIVRTSLHKGSGQVTHIMELSKQIIRMGHNVTIFARDMEVDLNPLSVSKIKPFLNSIPFIRHFTFMTAFEKMINRSFEVIHTQYHPAVFAGSYTKIFKKLPHVFTYHGFAPITLWRNTRQKLKMIDHRIGTFNALRYGIDKIIAVSHFLRLELEKKYMVDPNRIHVIYNGIDCERFNPSLDTSYLKKKLGIEKSLIVLFVGRLAPYKGAQYLLEAIPQVNKVIKNVKFLFVGSPRYDSPQIGKLLNDPKVRRNIIFTGYVTNEDLPKYYTACDIFCFPSLWEGFGLPPGEAQACGKPVISFNHCALPEVIVDNLTGILVSPKNSKALGEAIVKLLEDEDTRIKMGKAARKRVKTIFRWEKAAEETIKVYTEIS